MTSVRSLRSSIFLLVAIVVAAADTGATAQEPVHRVAIQVNQNDKAVMDLALNNAKNVIDYYKAKGETVAIEIVTYGPGLHMLRADTSPVKERIAPMALENSNLAFIACGNTQANQSKAEGKPVTLFERGQGHAFGCGSLDRAAETGLRVH
jgi:uncharacterized protein